MEASEKIRVFEESSALGLLIKLSVPTVITTMIMLIYNLADIFFIGQTHDGLQVAAVSLCAPIFSLLSGVGMLFGNGGCIRCSQLLGEGRSEDVKRVSAFCVWGSVAAGAVIAAAMLVLRGGVLRLLGASEETWTYTRSYLTVMLLGVPLMLFTQAMSSLLRADGEVRSPMYGNIIGSVTNIALDPLFILTLGWGVRGAAIATVIANAVNCLWLVGILHRKCRVFSADPRLISPKWRFTGAVLLLGLPMMVSTLLSSFSGVLTNHFLGDADDLLIAANGISSKLRMIVTMLVMGVCMGVQPAISYFHGARDHRRLREIVRVTAVTTTVIGVILSVVFYVFRDGVIRAFIDDPSVAGYGSQMILGTMISGPVQGLYQLCTSYLQGTGSVTLSTLLATSRQAVHIPLLVAGNAALGFIGVVYSSSVATFLCVGLGIWMCVLHAKRVRRREERG